MIPDRSFEDPTFETEKICGECNELITAPYEPKGWELEQYLKLPDGVEVCSESCLIKFLGA